MLTVIPKKGKMIKKKIKQKTIVEQVMEEIKNLIASGQYKVDDKIPSEAELCEMFGVSRPTIREAIKVFNYLGVLEATLKPSMAGGARPSPRRMTSLFSRWSRTTP